MMSKTAIAALVVFLLLIVAALAVSSQSSTPAMNAQQTVNQVYAAITAATVATSSHVSLDNLAPSIGKLPTSVGQCDETTITKIGTRLQNADGSDVPGSGSAVWYADGGYQVAYTTIEGITDSRVGDKVMLCLVSVPTDCPQGDDRGRIYQAINLRTAEAWTAQNSEHSCGGA